MDLNSTNISDADITNSSNSGVGIIIVSGACFLICLWCVTLNGLLILCFWINKRESWFSHSKNILSIIIIDLFVGLTTLSSLLFSMKTGVNVYECIVAMGLCLSSQTATSLNVLRFCITRFCSIKQTFVKREPSASIIVTQTLIIWLLSSVIVLVPLILRSGKQQVLKRCQWHYLFSVTERDVDLYMFCVLTLPTVTTTFIYGILALKLRNFIYCVKKKTETLDVPATDDKLSNENLCHITELSTVYASKPADECSNVRKHFLSDVLPKTVNKSETCTVIKDPLSDAYREQKLGEQEATLNTEKTKHMRLQESLRDTPVTDMN